MYTTHNLPPQAQAIETVAFMLSAEVKALPESLDDARLEVALTPTDEKGFALLEQFSQELNHMLAPWGAQIE